MLETKIEALTTAICELTKRIDHIAASKPENTGATAKVKKKKEEQQQESGSGLDKEKALEHNEIIPLVQELSQIDRDRAREIVKHYAPRVTDVPLDKLPALHSDIVNALVKLKGQ